MVRWRQTAFSPEALKTAQDVFRPDLYEAALGIQGQTHRGAANSVGAFSGPTFDPADVAGYLASFTVSRRLP